MSFAEDHLRRLATHAGFVVPILAEQAHYEYDAFGNQVVATGPEAEGNAWRFSTKPVDEETGYSYYGYRWYVAEMGRWTRRDPIGEAGGVNLYVMVGNHAVYSADLFGLLDAICPKEKCCGLKVLTPKLNEKVSSEIAKGGSLEDIRDRLSVDVSHPDTGGLTKIDAWIQDLGKEYRCTGARRTALGGTLDSGKRYASCVQMECNGKKTCIGADKISHFFQQGFMLYEVFKATGSQAYADAFSKWTEGLYDPPSLFRQPGVTEAQHEQLHAINLWLNTGHVDFHGTNEDSIPMLRRRWGGIGRFLGLLEDNPSSIWVSRPSIADHNANRGGLQFWRQLANGGASSFSFCDYFRSMDGLRE